MIKSEEFQRALVQGLGLPLEGCTGAEIDSEWNGKVTVTVRYLVSREVVAEAARILGELK